MQKSFYRIKATTVFGSTHHKEKIVNINQICSIIQFEGSDDVERCSVINMSNGITYYVTETVEELNDMLNLEVK